MRAGWAITIAPLGRWPDAAGGREMSPFKYIRWHHRTPAATGQVAVCLDGPPSSNLDDDRTWDLIDPGERRVRNVGGVNDVAADDLHLLNLDTTTTVTVYLEISDTPIVDLISRAAGVSSPGVVRIEDGVSTTLASVGPFHNSDNQTLPASGAALLTAGVAQLLNLLANADRQRETGQDGIPAQGIVTGAAQFAQSIYATSTTAIAANAASPQTFTLAAGGAPIGVPGGFQVGGVVLVDVAGTQDVGLITAVNAGASQITVTLPTGSTFHAHGPASYVLQSFVFNQERDASGELDNAKGIGAATAAEYEFNQNGYDRGRNVQGKGRASGTLNGAVAANATSLLLNAAPGPIAAGTAIYCAYGTAREQVVYSARSGATVTGNTINLDPLGPTTIALLNADTVEWDVFANEGPGLGQVLPTGIEIAEDVVWDPITKKFFLKVAATGDANSGQNAVLEVEGLVNPAGTVDRAHSLGSAGDGLGVELAIQPSSTPQQATGGANGITTLTLALVVGQQHRLTFLSVHATGGAPAAALAMTVTDGTTTWTFIVPTTCNTQEFLVPLPPGGIKFAVGAAVTITVPAAGAGITTTVQAGKLTA